MDQKTWGNINFYQQPQLDILVKLMHPSDLLRRITPCVHPSIMVHIWTEEVRSSHHMVPSGPGVHPGRMMDPQRAVRQSVIFVLFARQILLHADIDVLVL